MIARAGWGLVARREAVVVHASESWFETIGAGEHSFFNRFTELPRPVALVRAESLLARALLRNRRHRHVLAGAPPYTDAWHLHADVAPWPGFWRLDPKGSRARSALAEAPFPGPSDPARAAAFVAALRKPVPPVACDAVFFAQDIEDFCQPLHHLASAQILRGMAEALPGARLLLRLHPRQKPARAALLTALAAELGIGVTTAPAEALIAGAGVVVTQNSACGFQALVAGRPVITCARSDFGAVTTVARGLDELARGLRHAAPHPETSDFVHWYLAENCLAPEAPDFLPRLAALLA